MNTPPDKQAGLTPLEPESRAEQAFLEQARTVLDRGCDGLDGYTRSRLNVIRHEALARVSGKSGFARWMPATGIATACTVLVVLVLFPGLQGENEVTEPLTGDTLQNLDLLTAEEGLEFFEDYEFYQWLAENAPQA